MENRGPLKGIRVIDVSHQAAGPWCTTLLGDMGAEVWKIEKPDRGDSIRYARGADPKIGSYNFWGLNRNKKSVGVDVKHPDGVALVKEMVAGADVLVENFRPGVMDRLGLGYDDLQGAQPAPRSTPRSPPSVRPVRWRRTRAWISSCKPPAA